MGNVILALFNVFQLSNLLAIAGGVLCGIFVGLMPGLSSVMGLSIMLPFTFQLEGSGGILMMIGLYCGAVYGGSITACLLNTPGTANAAATCLDGYPLSVKYRQPGRAIGMSTFASVFGGLFASIMLLLTSPLLAKVALKFSAPEYFALAVFGLSIVTSVSSKSIIKGLFGAVIGLLLATVGIDLMFGQTRFTFGTVYLMGGISFIPILIGLFAFSQGLITVEEEFNEKKEKRKHDVSLKSKQYLPSFSDVKLCMPTVLRSEIGRAHV